VIWLLSPDHLWFWLSVAGYHYLPSPFPCLGLLLVYFLHNPSGLCNLLTGAAILPPDYCLLYYNFHCYRPLVLLTITTKFWLQPGCCQFSLTQYIFRCFEFHTSCLLTYQVLVIIFYTRQIFDTPLTIRVMASGIWSGLPYLFLSGYFKAFYLSGS